MSTPQSRLDLLAYLIRIPGVSASEKEDSVSRFIYDWFSSLDWFREHPEFLKLFPTPLEGDKRLLHAVAAFVKAAKPGKRTVILTGHYDVVDAAIYGEHREAAFDPSRLEEILKNMPLDPVAKADLESGDFLFGRGSMDMKCGIAVEMEIMRDFAQNRDMFDVNLLFLAVPDEENLSAGMRGAVPFLDGIQRAHGLEFLAAINAEPTEAGLPSATSPLIFLGTVGKLMPAFLCIGRETHVGSYYDGFSAALLASSVVGAAEANPELADPGRDACCPSWICLELKILKDSYSVTVPGEAVAYFNCYATANSPAKVLAQMRTVALQAFEESIAKIRRSREMMLERGLPDSGTAAWQPRVLSVEDIRELAAARLGKEALAEQIREFTVTLAEPDPREAAIAVMRRLVELSGEKGPLIVTGFLPPYYPPRSSLVSGPGHQALVRAADHVVRVAGEQHGVTVRKAPWFTGLCDLSYFGYQGATEDLKALQENLPGWGEIYSVPVAALSSLDIPIVNFGPSGRDPHRKTERLEKKYSLSQYPLLLEELIRAIARENS